jgi:HEAT repeat protein
MDLRGSSSEIAFGVASDGLMYGNDKLQSLYAQKFAQALYMRGVAVLRFDSATSQDDLEKFLRRVGVGITDPDSHLWDEVSSDGITTIRLMPVDYSGVRVTDTLDKKRKETGASLWEEILRALVAGHEMSPAAKRLLEHEVTSAGELSASILQYMEEVSKEKKAEFDPDATFGVRFKSRPEAPDTPEAMRRRIAEAVGSFIAESTTEETHAAVEQALDLVRSLPEPLHSTVIRSVLERLAVDEKHGAALADFSRDLPPADVMEALQQLSSVKMLSSYALKLLQSLAAMRRPSAGAAAVDPNLISDLVQLFGEDDADRFNPPDHQELLDSVAINIPHMAADEDARLQRLGDRASSVTDEALNRQMGMTLLDLLERFGTGLQTNTVLSRAETIFLADLSAGQFADALEFIQRLQEIAEKSGSVEFRSSIQDALGRLASQATIDSLVDNLHNAPPEKTAIIQRLMEAMGSAATRTLLITLAEESSRSRRRRLFDFVAKIGPSIVPEVRGFLSDSRWYVVRNMIVLLRSVNDRTSLPQIRELGNYPDLRVRLEAIKTLLALDSTVPRIMLENAINDPDPKLAETAIALVGNYGIKEGVEPLLNVVAKKDLFFTRKPIRVRAIKALGELAVPSALEQLRPFFTDSILPWPAREERRAAYESLVAYSTDLRKDLVQKGLRSRDPKIREICRRLSVLPSRADGEESPARSQAGGEEIPR